MADLLWMLAGIAVGALFVILDPRSRTIPPTPPIANTSPPLMTELNSGSWITEEEVDG